MNWRSVKNLSEDDYGKPLLFRMPFDEDLPVNYFAGEIRDGEVRTFAYVDDYGNDNTFFTMAIDNIPSKTYFVRIDEIKD